MFAKLVVLIVSLGVCGGTLLVQRQARLQAAHELTEARLRVRKVARELLTVRAEIAARSTPSEVERMSEQLGETAPALESDELKAESGEQASIAD